jgi:hypothetical protein
LGPVGPETIYREIDMALRMREGWEPPYPLMKAEFGSDVSRICVALIGVQSRDGLGLLPDEALLDEENGPTQVDCAEYVDGFGYKNRFWIAYWTDAEKFDAWRRDSAIRRWLADPARLIERPGYWLETFSIARDDFESIFGTANPAGVSCAAAQMIPNDRTHGYWGSMRDRIPNSSNDAFVSPLGNKLQRSAARNTFGKRWRVKAPTNLCYIRSGQDYAHCGPEQRKTYVDEIAPVLKSGMDFLRDNPEETGCCSLRFAEVVGSNGAKTEQTFGLGYFLSIGNLEDWSSTHRTHLVIFSKWQHMYRKYNFILELRTWHEVAILRDQTEFEYVNCHPETGLLPFFEAEEFPSDPKSE